MEINIPYRGQNKDSNITPVKQDGEYGKTHELFDWAMFNSYVTNGHYVVPAITKLVIIYN